MRVNTIRHSAWFAWRFPPRLSRWRTVLPDDAERRDAAEVRPRGFGTDPLRVVTRRGDQQDRSGVDADAVDLEQARRGVGDELGEDSVEVIVVGVEREHVRRPRVRIASLVAYLDRGRSRGEDAARRPGGDARPGHRHGSVRAAPPGRRNPGGATGSGRYDARPRALSAWRPAAPGSPRRCRRRSWLGPARDPRQRSPSRLDRVEGVGLAGPSSLLAVGAIDLDHLDPGCPRRCRASPP